jgi:hypothetical protein
MTANNTSTKKAKGRKLQQQIANDLIKHINKYCLFTDEPTITELDIKSIGMGQSGRDIELSSYGEKKIPFDIECKNQERVNIWQWIEQAEKNNKNNLRTPLIIFKRNRSKIYAVIEWDKLLSLL